MIKLERSIMIYRTVQDVWNYMSNLENAAQWDRGVLEAKQISDGPPGVGSIIQTRRQYLGREQIRKLRIVEWEPNKVVKLESSIEQMTAHIRYTFEPVGEGTKLTGSAEIEVKGLYKLLTPIIIRMGDKDNEADLTNVKRKLEAQY